jgi:transposase
MFIKCALNVVCVNVKKENNKEKLEVTELNEKFIKFYDEHYKDKYVDCDISSRGLKTLFEYIAKQIVTVYENNIKNHFYDYVRRFVNNFFNKKEVLTQIRAEKIKKADKDKKIKNICSKINTFTNDLLNIQDENFKSNNHYHPMIKLMKTFVLPNKKIFSHNNLLYDIKENPMDYFKCMFSMMSIIENEEKTIYNLFPLRTNLVPKHMKLDTTTLVNLLMETNKEYYRNNLVILADEIWSKFFKINSKVFRKKGYKFDHSINTDGISCCIQFIRTEYYGKFIPPQKKNMISEKYIDDLEDTEYERLQTKHIVSIDPNKSDLIYCVDDIIKERNHFRYTQDQRRKETKQKKYRNIILEQKENLIDNKKVCEWETELSEHNRKTLNFEKFKLYLEGKHKLNNKLEKFYENELFRKLNLNGYLNRMYSEQRMIKNFKNIFGPPESTIICIGDWDQKQQMKFKEPTKGKGFRELFRKEGYEVYLVNEFRTSCRCSICEEECENFRVRNSPRPWKQNTKIMVHGLLKCKNCKVLWNRDENSSNNIYILARSAINKVERPKYLCREKKEKESTKINLSITDLTKIKQISHILSI